MTNKFFKFLIVTGTIFMVPVSASAKIMIVESVSEFSTTNPPKTIQVQLRKEIEVDNFELYQGTVINCEITEVKAPKRLKRDATFSFVPVSYINDQNETVHFPVSVKAKYIKTIDKKTAESAAITAAKTVSNKIVPGLGLGVGAIEGAIDAENGQKIKGAATGVYESTPFSWVEKGKELTIERGDGLLIRVTR
ncbi:hypothetical protein IKP85_06005 [bacterium]|nr:hypothetical protein [bacterium]